MRIDINEEICLTSDSDQITVNMKRTVTKKDSENFGKEALVPLAYLKNLPQCAKFLIDHKVRVSDATTFKELLEEVRQFKKELMELLDI